MCVKSAETYATIFILRFCKLVESNTWSFPFVLSRVAPATKLSYPLCSILDISFYLAVVAWHTTMMSDR